MQNVADPNLENYQSLVGTPRRATCVLVALALTCGVALWQTATVRFNYGGNWTGLYCTGDTFPPPAPLHSENILIAPQSRGYDGQFYHYAAHDPLFKASASQSFDSVRLRYGRILIPAVAYLLAGGRAEWVDGAYVCVVWSCFFLGAYWLARLAVLSGRSPLWGLAMGLLPASVVSMDRLTVDIGLAALSVGFVLLLATGRTGWQLYLLLVAAGLTRDSGLLLAAGLVIWLMVRKDWKRAILFSTTAVPALAWYAYVASKAPAQSGDQHLAWPLLAPLQFALSPMPYPFAPSMTLLLQALDLLAVCGVLLALGWSLWLLRPKTASPERWTMALFSIAVQIQWQWPNWREASYGLPRVLTPMLVLLAMEAFRGSSRWAYLPLVLMLPRVGMELASQTLSIIRGAM